MRCAARGEDAPGRLDSVDLWHLDVHQDDRWVQPLGHGDGIEPVAGFRHDFDVLLAGEQHPEARPDH
jgi:hypothetical protein